MINKIFILFGVALMVFLSACSVQKADSSGLCTDLGGNWVDSANECEYISQGDCENIGGSFNECASACRNDPNAELCTLQCVPVCSLG
jgi:hypothetical protein